MTLPKIAAYLGKCAHSRRFSQLKAIVTYSLMRLALAILNRPNPHMAARPAHKTMPGICFSGYVIAALISAMGICLVHLRDLISEESEAMRMVGRLVEECTQSHKRMVLAKSRVRTRARLIARTTKRWSKLCRFH